MSEIDVAVPFPSIPEIRRFLLERSWVVTHSTPSFELWGRTGDEVLVPLGVRGSDFARRMEELFSALERAGETDVDEFRGSLRAPEPTTVLFRAVGRDLDRGSIPLDDAARALDGIRRVVVAAGCSVIEPKSHHGRSRPAQAVEVASRLRLGRTVEGSYAFPFTVERSSAPFVLGYQTAGGASIPVADRSDDFSRATLATMRTALGALRDLVADEDPWPAASDLIPSAVESGVSAETCSALADVLDTESVENLEVSFGWSSPDGGAPGDGPLVFRSSSSGVLRQIGARLRREVPESDVVVIGTVSRLSRGSDDDDGNVVVRARVGDAYRQVRMTLDEHQYHEAIVANDRRSDVEITGTLSRSTSGSYLIGDVVSFRRIVPEATT